MTSAGNNEPEEDGGDRAEAAGAAGAGTPCEAGPAERLLGKARYLRGAGDLIGALLVLEDPQIEEGGERLRKAAAGLQVRCLFELRLHREAVRRFEAYFGAATSEVLRAIAPEHLVAYVRALERSGRAGEASEVLQRAQIERPAVATWYEEQALLLQWSEPAQALEQIEIARALVDNPCAGALREATIRLRCGEPLAVVRRLALQAFAADPPVLQALLLLALVEQRAGRHDLALGYINRLLRAEGSAEIGFADAADGCRIDNLRPAVESEPKVGSGPLVTVLMTAFNAAPFVETAVRSVLAQSYANLELLIVDDASTDETGGILAGLAAEDSRVRFLRSGVNLGTYGAKNLALPLARGDFVTCHDADDWSHPHKLERQVQVLLDRANLVASVSQWARLDEAGHFVLQRWKHIVYTNASSLLYRREVLDRLGFYDSVRAGADSEFQARLETSFGRNAVQELSTCLAFGRYHTASLTGGGAFSLTDNERSEVRQRYREFWFAWQRRRRAAGQRDCYLPFPLEKRHFAAPRELIVPFEQAVQALSAKGKRNGLR